MIPLVAGRLITLIISTRIWIEDRFVGIDVDFALCSVLDLRALLVSIGARCPISVHIMICFYKK